MAQSRLHSDKLVDEMLTHLHVDFADHEPNSEVATFYSGRSVFITGATGFIGKVTRGSKGGAELLMVDWLSPKLMLLRP